MFERIDNAYTLLAEDVIDALDDASEDPAYSHIEAVVEAVEPIWEQLCDDGFDCEKTKKYVEIADLIADIAKKFSYLDGSALTELDDLDLIPE